MKRTSLIAAIWTALASFAGADEQWQVTAHVDIYQLPEKDALTLIPRFGNANEATDAFGALLERANSPGSGTRRMATLTARSVEGYPVGVRVGEDLKYCIEYEQEDPRVGIPLNTPPKLPLATGYPSTTFETRDCGAELNFVAKVSADGQSILFAHQLKHTIFDRWTRYETAVRSDGVKLFVEQPEFVQRHSAGVVLATIKTPILLGSYRIPEKEKTFELHILFVSTRRMDLPKLKPSPTTGNLTFEYLVPALPANFPTRDIWLDVMTFSVPGSTAMAFREKMVNNAESNDALALLLNQSESGAVHLIDWQTVPSLAGGRAVTENTHEIRYAIEPEAPRSIPIFSVTQTPSVAQSFGSRNFWELPTWQGEPCMEPPTTFETRNVGTSLEVDSRVPENFPGFPAQATADPPPRTSGEMSLNSSHVTLAHFLRWGGGPNRFGKVSYAFQPQFESRRFSGILFSGFEKPVLVRFAREPGASDRFEVALLRAHRRQMPSAK